MEKPNGSSNQQFNFDGNLFKSKAHGTVLDVEGEKYEQLVWITLKLSDDDHSCNSCPPVHPSPPGQPDNVSGAQAQEPELQVCPCLGGPRGGKQDIVYKNNLINGMPSII